MPRWKRNLYVLCAAQLVTLIGFTAYLSFFPYYVLELGVTSETAAMSWTAALNITGAVGLALFAPFWGSLADRHGRKLMVVRATLAGALIAGLMSIVRSPLQLSILRFMQGALCGTMTAAIALVAADTPEREITMALGLMQTAQYVGQSVGPLLGGVTADAFGFRAVFQVAAVLIVLALAAIVLLVKEEHKHPAPVTTRAAPPASLSLTQRARRIVSGNVLVLILAMASNAFALSILSPVLGLYIMALDPGSTRLGTLAGSVASVTALMASLTAIGIGRIAYRVGEKRVLLICVAGIALCHVPQALATSTVQLLIWRGIQGAFTGGVLPTANALLARSSAANRRATMFGFSASAQSAARAIGPGVGAAVATAWGMPSAFWLTAVLLVLLAVMVAGWVRPTPSEVEAPELEATVEEAC